MAVSPWVFTATTADFEEKVLNKSKETPVVVDFWAPWCGPCRSLAPILERLVNERAGQVLLAKVNIDEEQNLAMAFRVNSIPLVIAFRDGKAAAEFEGLVSEHQMVEFLDRLCPSQADRLVQQAASLEMTNPVESEKLYRQALAADENHELAILGLCRQLIAQNQDSEAAERLDRLGPGSEHGEEVEKLAAILWLRRLAQDRGDEPTLRHQVELDPKNATARYDLGCVLAAEGKYPEALSFLLQAAELNRKLATEKVKEAMVKVFHAVGNRSPLADEYRQKLTAILY